MTTMTETFANTEGRDAAYYVGRADAYDDAKTLTTEEMDVRSYLYAVHHPDFWYVAGYSDRLLEQRREDVATAAAESVLAWEPLPAVTR